MTTTNPTNTSTPAKSDDKFKFPLGELIGGILFDLYASY